jgi:hypothetical protein
MHFRGMIALAGATVLAGCASVAAVNLDQTIATSFSTGAHSVDLAEMTYLKQVQTVDCANQFYTTARAFTQKQTDLSFDLLLSCDSKELTNAQLQARQQVMDAIVTYADGIQSLLSGGSNQSMASACEATAKQIQSSNIPDVTAGETAATSAAVTSLAQILMDNRENADVKAIASKAEPVLETLVITLKSENTNDSVGIAMKLTNIKHYFMAALEAARTQKGEASLLDVTSAHSTLRALSVASDTTSLNRALDALVASNRSLMTGDKLSAMQEVTNLVNEGKNAQAIYSASSASK